MTSPHSPNQTSTEYIAREIVLGPDKSMIGMIEAPKVISDDAHILIQNIKSAIDAERTRVEEAEKEIERLYAEVFVGSHFRCPKCKFYLTQNFITPIGIFANKETPPNCPNDNTEMMSVTWKELSMSQKQGAEKLMEIIRKMKESFEIIKEWSDCYCMTEEESSKPGGITCPTCIAKEALKD